MSEGPSTDRVRSLLTVQQFCAKHPAFTEGGLRWFLFQRDDNGLHRAVVKFGRRILIDEGKFFEWLDAHQEQDFETEVVAVGGSHSGK